MRTSALAILLAALALAGCATAPVVATAPAPQALYPDDPHSLANPNEVTVEHLDLDLSVNFPEEKLVGVASLVVNNRTGADALRLDTRDLEIKRVTLGSEARPTEWRLGEAQGVLGRPLVIDVEPGTRRVTVEYETTPGAAALQWLEPAQTAGDWPFLFTQSQAILARTWIPLQDTPAVRFTYDATIRAPQPLMAVMSAENPTEREADGIYEFTMPQPIPSYLMALAVGDLEFRPLGDRAGVYAEPSVVDRAAWEFAQTPEMIEAAERLYGPYRWGRYDILVLPASFPFGGMENPRLTFATPTVLAGDRSLVALIAHELAHSWSGNLVTNATWNDFWLNEGFTTYIENRIMEEVYGVEQARLLQALGRQDLEEEIAAVAEVDERLKLELAGRDPDEGMTEVAYQKGALFLRLLEETVGRERLDAFLRQWFDTFAFQSRTTEDFVAYLEANLLTEEEAAAVDVAAWVYEPGVPANAPVVESPLIAEARAQAEAFVWGTAPAELETEGWGTHEWLLFIRALPKLTPPQMAQLDEEFGFLDTGNSEILFAWLMKAIESGYRAAYPRLEEFLMSVGRRKFVLPLFEQLAKTPEGMEMAKRIYERARPRYHPVTQQSVDAALGWEAGS
ncbi:MAG: M1 family metallopeptidase [Thermoanaerobaculia bacterium]